MTPTPRSPNTKKRTGASKPPDLSERAFQQQITDLARRCGWRVGHVGDSRKQVRRGDRTFLVGDAEAAGLPDLLLVHPKRGLIIFAELKRRTGRLRVQQVAWVNDLAAAGATVYVWRPEHWDAIEKVLTGR